ncbi:MAG TPA: hypothetical protein VFT57_19755, partial [Gemmatimonadaceae bacterium]|nr:hypothetical protein [Gemmatimonadaceae bacterium]
MSRVSPNCSVPGVMPRMAGRLVAVLLAISALFASRAGAQEPGHLSAPRWYRGNTHVHTSNSDGNSAPLDVVRWYREHAYDFLVITDHEYITDPAPINALYGRPGRFLVIRG